FGKDVKQIDADALAMLMAYSFPGNVRELESAIERAIIMCSGDKLEKEHFPLRILQGWKPAEASQETIPSLAELESRHILDVLNATRGNKSEAAKILGINRASLWRKLKNLGYED
ncbi:MAG: helix-turn-helix domain-containing protein, partial [Desulfosarcinaceae bacterium]